MLFRMWYGLGMLVRHRTFGSIPYIGEGGVKGGSGGRGGQGGGTEIPYFEYVKEE